MIFNLAHLRYFYDAARTGNISEAARRNHVSQSALSQGIRNLGRDLDNELITHQKNRFKLTDAGKIVYAHADRIFAGVEELNQELQKLSGEIAGEITFACTNSIARALIPGALLAAREKYPLLKVRFHRGSVRYILEQLSKGTVDFGVVLGGDAFKHLENEVIHQGQFFIYQRRGLEQAPEDEIYVDHVDSTEAVHLKKCRPSLSFKEELSGWGMVEQFVKQGLGQGLLPDFMEHNDPISQIQRTDCSMPDIPYSICAVYPKGVLLSRNMRAFIDLLASV
jgi:DNA-binding transcriptional LysR family regulator